MDDSIPQTIPEITNLIEALRLKIEDDQKTLNFLVKRRDEMIIKENLEKIKKAKEYIQSLALTKEQLAEVIDMKVESSSLTSSKESKESDEEEDESDSVDNSGPEDAKTPKQEEQIRLLGTPEKSLTSPKSVKTPIKKKGPYLDYTKYTSLKHSVGSFCKKIPKEVVEAFRAGNPVKGYVELKKLPKKRKYYGRQPLCIYCESTSAKYGNTTIPPCVLCNECAYKCVYTGKMFKK